MVEIVVALGLVMVAALGSLIVFSFAATSQGASQRSTDALEVAQGELERLRSSPRLTVAFNQTQYNAMQANTSARTQWLEHLGTDVALVRTDGTIAPRSTDVNGEFTVLRYVSCGITSATCASGSNPLTRTARVVVIGPSIKVTLTSRISPKPVGATPSTGSAPSAVTGLTAAQLGDDVLQLNWTASPRAASYRITRNGVFLTDTLANVYPVSDVAMRAAGAARTATFCVIARSSDRISSAGTCVTILLRPASLSANANSATSASLNWQSGSLGSGILGYRVERKRTYADVIMADRPIAYYPFDEASGATKAADATGRGADLNYLVPPVLGEPSLLPGQSAGSSARWSGADKLAFRPSTPAGLAGGFADTQGITIETWIKFTGAPSTTGGTFVKVGGTDNGCGPANGVGFGMGSGTLDTRGYELVAVFDCVRWVPSGYSFPKAGTYHVAMTVDGAGSARFYVNGGLVAVNHGAGPRNILVSEPMAIGYNPNPLSRGLHDVALDEMAIFAGVLPQARIEAHYQAGISGAPWLADNPVGYWQLGTPGNVVNDLSGNGKHMTWYGGATTNTTAFAPFAGQRARQANAAQYGVAPPIDLRNSSFTVVFWYRATHLGGGATFSTFSGSYANNQVIVAQNIGDGRINFAYWGDDFFSSVGAMDTSGWHLLAFTYSQGSDTSRIYVDGVLRGSGPQGGFTGAGVQNFNVNYWYGPSQGAVGEFGDFAVFKSDLTQSRIREMYEQRTDPLYSGDWRVISGASLLSAASFTDNAAGCDARYRVRVYRNTPAAGQTEGNQFATSSEVRPSGGPC
ncbi:LamG domain-containing protein [Miltoncostaea oceani]|uniref:LamG domain-containing protein n=1 Tax=Miltoncostaea oceani TaxID=2843216 RepID=UPI001C3CE87B|nr:LamG domain-containing protein [Miltoncostaea oceani]